MRRRIGEAGSSMAHIRDKMGVASGWSRTATISRRRIVPVNTTLTRIGHISLQPDAKATYATATVRL